MNADDSKFCHSATRACRGAGRARALGQRQGRHPRLPFQYRHKFLPEGLSLAAEFTTLSPDEQRFVSQIQGRPYANTFGLVQRFINAKCWSSVTSTGSATRVALEALVRFSDEELKHQGLFGRIDADRRGPAGRLSLRHQRHTTSRTQCSAKAPGRCSR